MKFFRDLRLLTWRPLLHMLRNPTWLVVSLSTPIMYLVLFLPLLNTLGQGPAFSGASSVIQIFLPGILAFIAFGAGNGSGFSTIFDLKNGLIERLRVTPSSRMALLLGPIVANTISTIFFSAIIVAISSFFDFSIHIWGLLVFGILLLSVIWLFSALFTALAILTKEINSFAAIANGLNLPILLLSGMLLPLSIGPNWLQILGHFNPLYYVVNAGRDLAVGEFTTQAVLFGFVVIIPLTTFVLIWATKVYRRAVN